MVRWIKNELGESTPLHLSRYFPSYQSLEPTTPMETLENFYEIASELLKYVFLGNVSDNFKSSTFCPQCGVVLIQRTGYLINITGLSDNNKCNTCGYQPEIIMN